MKTCLYSYTQGLYQTECGSKLLLRPHFRCDKCGRKLEEVRNAINGERQESQKGDDKTVRD